jgi:hypothetical protein
MYIAYKTMQDNNHHGSTKLHMDITDAVNLMLWAADSGDGATGYALWHIFSASASCILHKFLIEEQGAMEYGDPIHSQAVYLTPDMLQRLYNQHGIRPYTIYQRQGDAVYIPAYCAHQVCYLSALLLHTC